VALSQIRNQIAAYQLNNTVMTSKCFEGRLRENLWCFIRPIIPAWLVSLKSPAADLKPSRFNYLTAVLKDGFAGIYKS
jgi:hypothetical protein